MRIVKTAWKSLRSHQRRSSKWKHSAQFVKTGNLYICIVFPRNPNELVTWNQKSDCCVLFYCFWASFNSIPSSKLNQAILRPSGFWGEFWFLKYFPRLSSWQNTAGVFFFQAGKPPFWTWGPFSDSIFIFGGVVWGFQFRYFNQTAFEKVNPPNLVSRKVAQWGFIETIHTNHASPELEQKKILFRLSQICYHAAIKQFFWGYTIWKVDGGFHSQKVGFFVFGAMINQSGDRHRSFPGGIYIYILGSLGV